MDIVELDAGEVGVGHAAELLELGQLVILTKIHVRNISFRHRVLLHRRFAKTWKIFLMICPQNIFAVTYPACLITVVSMRKWDINTMTVMIVTTPKMISFLFGCGSRRRIALTSLSFILETKDKRDDGDRIETGTDWSRFTNTE